MFMKKSILQMAIGILVVALLTANLVVSMRKETKEPNIKPLSSFLMPTKDDWKVTYGDTLETQMVYNIVVGRFDQKAIFSLVQKYHATDPNEVTK